jgi:hypothetical protein
MSLGITGLRRPIVIAKRKEIRVLTKYTRRVLPPSDDRTTSAVVRVHHLSIHLASWRIFQLPRTGAEPYVALAANTLAC